ncbi:hypothetical protein [Streptomyces sp. NPDC048489]|uniref:hypothetical protein n=1 Tax=Streptomyces sp. NPDC048489 TaxID=3154504 RepID=UPI00343A1914
MVPALGHTRAPHPIDSRHQDLAPLLTAVPGAPTKELGLDAAQWRTVHQQAGALCARLHDAGPLDHHDQVEAEISLPSAAEEAEKNLARTGDWLDQDEQQRIRDHAARLRRVGPVPIGYIHGGNQPKNWLRSTRGLTLLTCPGCCRAVGEADASAREAAVDELGVTLDATQSTA